MAVSFVGYHDRVAPDGTRWPGCQDFDSLIRRLSEIEKMLPGPTDPLIAWGFDPIFFGTERMTVQHLDRVSTTRPIVIMHASLHLMNVNSATLAKVGISRDTEVQGIARFPDGEPSGELKEPAAMFPVMRLIGNVFQLAGTGETSLRLFGRVAELAGVTTATDLVNDLADEDAETMRRVTAKDDFPVRLVPAFLSIDGSLTNEAGAARVRQRMAQGHAKLHYGLIKIIVDGSIQGFSDRLRWPGYFNGAPNGIWLRHPAELIATVAHFHAAGFRIHIHANGDEAIELALDGLEAALEKHPRLDHRHTLQHCQMADGTQFRRMARLGVCANLFANHIYYWGDIHHDTTMGPDRAARINGCATALNHGVPLAIHSDAPITPLGPLFTAWCAVNRVTASGRILGAAESLTVPQALHAITLGAAFTLGLDDRVGSIESGKFADFCVLQENPLAVPPMALKDVPIAATVLGGRVLTRPRE